jgi:SAM-dependent methyltransferase
VAALTQTIAGGVVREDTRKMVSARAYDFMYRRGAPWEGGPRSELVELVESGRLAAVRLPRAVDLGCGSGANAIFLAEHGFEVTGVDFSQVALEKAAAKAGPDLPVRWVNADLTDPGLADRLGEFDLLVDYGTLDDLKGQKANRMAELVTRLAHPGSQLLLWCFYDEVAWWRRKGARFPGLKPGFDEALFGDTFAWERNLQPSVGSGFACFLGTRR